MSTYVTLELVNGEKVQLKSSLIVGKVKVSSFSVLPGLVAVDQLKSTAKECVAEIIKKYKTFDNLMAVYESHEAQLNDILNQITDLSEKVSFLERKQRRTAADEKKIQQLKEEITNLSKQQTPIIDADIEFRQYKRCLNVWRNAYPVNFKTELLRILMSKSGNKYAIVKLTGNQYYLVKDFELK